MAAVFMLAAGALLVIVGAFFVTPPLAIIAAGLFVFLVGLDLADRE